MSASAAFEKMRLLPLSMTAVVARSQSWLLPTRILSSSTRQYCLEASALLMHCQATCEVSHYQHATDLSNRTAGRAKRDLDHRSNRSRMNNGGHSGDELKYE